MRPAPSARRGGALEASVLVLGIAPHPPHRPTCDSPHHLILPQTTIPNRSAPPPHNTRLGGGCVAGCGVGVWGLGGVPCSVEVQWVVGVVGIDRGEVSPDEVMVCC